MKNIYKIALGAFTAVLLLYIFSLILTYANIGIFAVDGKRTTSSVIHKAALNVFVITTSQLKAEGDLPNNGEAIKASLKMPLTIWIFLLPICVYLGTLVYKNNIKTRTSIQLIIYDLGYSIIATILLLLLTLIAKAKIGTNIFPEISGTSINPPPIPFSVNINSILLLGLFFCFFSLIINRMANFLQSKFAIITLIFISSISMLYSVIGTTLISHKSKDLKASQLIEYSPFVGFLSYQLLTGSELNATVESKLNLSEVQTYKPLDIKASIRSIIQDDQNKKQAKHLHTGIFLIVLIWNFLLFVILGNILKKYKYKVSFFDSCYVILLLIPFVLASTNILAFDIQTQASSNNVKVGCIPSLIVLIFFVFSIAGIYLGSYRKKALGN